MAIKNGILIIMFCAALTLFGSGHSVYAKVEHPNGEPKNRKYYEQRGEITWEKPIKQKWIALTFDDGPDPNVTPHILSLLNQYHAKATFFCMGAKVKRNPKIANRIIAQGHEIGNHTYHHRKIQHLSIKELKHEIDLSQQITSQTTGFRPELFRPPEGIYNTKIVELAKNNQLKVIMWSWDQDTKDWTNPSTSFIVNKVTKNASNGDIVLFHDTQVVTAQALKQILSTLSKQGYQFVTVSKLLQSPN